MNRSIKFRAWNEKANEFAQPELVGIDGNGNIDLAGAEVDFLRIEFYTPFKDINGDQICAGDIMQYKWYSAYKKWWSTITEITEIEKAFKEQKDNYFTSVGEVIVRNGAFYVGNCGIYLHELAFDLSKTVWQKGMSGGDTERRYWAFEIIGNIHQNPELIK